MRRFLRDERGATAIEYALIAALVTVVLIVGVTALSDRTTIMYNYIGSSISGAITRSPS